MKTILAAALISLSGFSANAGNIAYESPQSVNIEIEPNMSVGLGGWIIPAVIVAVMVLVLTQEQEEECVECQF